MKNMFSSILPLNKESKKIIEELKTALTEESLKTLKKYLKHKQITFSIKSLNSTFTQLKYPMFFPITEEKKIKDFSEIINNQIRTVYSEKAFKEFSRNDSLDKIKKIFASDIVGLDEIKESIILSLISKEPIHILLFGDPGTGKTKIIKEISKIHSKTVFGLGSGISGVGLSLILKGNEIIEGLLPLADQGICCIDELNLLKEQDRGSLYSAMEDGYVSYDKQDKHIRLNARMTLIATANPGKGSMLLNSKKIAKSQLDFDPALISRFHLVFFIKKSSEEKFQQITNSLLNKKTKINDEDYEFIKEYIDYLREKEPYFNKEIKEYISKLSVELKKQENEFFVPLTPRKIIGLVRLSGSLAKIQNSKEVTKEHVDKAFKILEKSLKEFFE